MEGEKNLSDFVKCLSMSTWAVQTGNLLERKRHHNLFQNRKSKLLFDNDNPTLGIRVISISWLYRIKIRLRLCSWRYLCVSWRHCRVSWRHPSPTYREQTLQSLCATFYNPSNALTIVYHHMISKILLKRIWNICMCVRLSAYVSFGLSVCLPVCLSACLSVCPTVGLATLS